MLNVWRLCFQRPERPEQENKKIQAGFHSDGVHRGFMVALKSTSISVAIF